MLSYRSLMPAGAGTPRYENGCAGWRIFFAVARDQGWWSVCRERGTSPRATLFRSAIDHRDTNLHGVFADGRHDGPIADAFSCQ